MSKRCFKILTKSCRSKLAALTAAALVFTGVFRVPLFAEVINSDPPEAAISGEYVPGDVILCIRPEVADEKRIAAKASGFFGPDPDIDSGFLMDVSRAAEAFEEEGVLKEADGRGLSSVFSSALSGIFPSEKKNTDKTVLKLIHSDSLSTEELIKLYSGKPGVVFAEPNYKHSIDEVTEPEILTSPSNAETVSEHAPDLTRLQYAFGDGEGGMDVPGWNDQENINAKDTVVAVLDGGVDYENEDLKDVMWDEGEDYQSLKALGGGKFGINVGYEGYEGYDLTDKNDPMDVKGHGTHVAGIIAAAWNGYGVSGAANGVKIMAVKHSSDDEGTSYASSDIKGFNYICTAKDAGVNVVAVNCSFGGAVKSAIYGFCVKELEEKGIVTLWATGNDNVCNVGNDSMMNIPGLIAVNSMDIRGKKSSFSNYGLRTTHIFAPGSDIMSTYPDTLKDVIPDRDISNPVFDEKDNKLYDDFTSGEHNFEYEVNPDNGTVLSFEDDELQLSGSDYSLIDEDSITEETIAEGEDDRLAVLTVRPEGKLKPLAKGKRYSLIFNSRIEDEGTWYLMVYVKTRSGSFERPKLTNPMEKEYNYFAYPLDKSLNGNEFDLENPEIRFVLKKSDFSEPLKKAAIGELWITDAATYPYVYNGGTSLAAPAITGEAAILAARFPDDSAEKRAARILAGAKQNDDLKKLCITGGSANVRNSLDEKSYTPVINSISAEKDGLHIKGFFFRSEDNKEDDLKVNITQSAGKWSVSGHTLEIMEIRENKDGSEEIVLNIPEGMERGRETLVTVTDSGRRIGRQSYSRILIPADNDGILNEADDICTPLPISDEGLSLLRDYIPIDGIALDGALYFNFLSEIDYSSHTVSYKDGIWTEMEKPILESSGSATTWNGSVVEIGDPDMGRLYFHDCTRIIKTLDFVPVKGGADIPEGEEWILEPPDKYDFKSNLYFDGRDLYYFRNRCYPDKSGEYWYYCCVVYRVDPETGEGTYLGELSNIYSSNMLITHEEKDGKPYALYSIGWEMNYDDDEEEGYHFAMEKITLDPFKSESLSDALPSTAVIDEADFVFRGCGVRNGIYLTLPFEAVENDDGTGSITANNFFFDYAHPEKGFEPAKKRIADTRVFRPVAVAGYGKVYFLGLNENGLFMSCTEEDTLPHYGDTPEKQEKKVDYSDPASPLHLTDGADMEKLSTENAKYVFTLSSNTAIAGGTKADVSGFFENAPGYDSLAKHRYLSSDKKKAKVNKKGIVTAKKRGKTEITCEQKVKGGSWQPVGEKMQLYVQMPEMVKKADVKMGDSDLSAYSFLSKTTYSPTRWKSSNEKVATVDDNGNIKVLKRGKTNIIAEYGEGKTGSKKKYKTKLKVG